MSLTMIILVSLMMSILASAHNLAIGSAYSCSMLYSDMRDSGTLSLALRVQENQTDGLLVPLL